MKLDTKSNPNAAQVRLEPASPSKTAGQRKHELRIGRQPKYVDADRSHLNRVLIEPQTAATMRKRAVERRDRKPHERAMKSNAAVSFSGIITFGHLAHLRFERLTTEQQDAAFLDLAHAVAERQKAGLTGLVVHCDEAGLHAHFQLDAYDAAGNALSDTIKRADLRAVQDLTGEIMGRHCPGIERGHSKVERLKAGAVPADVVYKKPAEMRRRLAADLEQAEKARADLDTEREKLAARVAKLQAYGDELTEKGAKQLETAQRRLEAKEAAIRDLDAREARLRHSVTEATTAAQKATEMAEEAQRQERATAARLEPLRAAVAALDAHEAALQAHMAEMGEIQPEDAEASLAWLCEPLRTIEDDAKAFRAFMNRQAAGHSAPRTPASAAGFDLDAHIGTSKSDGLDAEKGKAMKTLLTIPEAYRLEIREAQGARPRRVGFGIDTSAVARNLGLSDDPDEWRHSFQWHNLMASISGTIAKIDVALSGIAAVIRRRKSGKAPDPAPPPEAKPAADLPPEVRQAIREAIPKGPTR